MKSWALAALAACLHLLRVGVGFAEQQILHDGPGEQLGLLRHGCHNERRSRYRKITQIGTPSMRILPDVGSKKRGIS